MTQKAYLRVRSTFLQLFSLGKQALLMCSGRLASERKSARCHLCFFSYCPVRYIEMSSFCYGDDKVNTCLETMFILLDDSGWLYDFRRHTVTTTNKKHQTRRKVSMSLEISGKMFSCIVAWWKYFNVFSGYPSAPQKTLWCACLTGL